MESSRKETTETYGQAAARLLQRLEQRAKTKSGKTDPARIQEPANDNAGVAATTGNKGSPSRGGR